MVVDLSSAEMDFCLSDSLADSGAYEVCSGEDLFSAYKGVGQTTHLPSNKIDFSTHSALYLAV